MTKPVRFDEEADAELTDAAVWYEKWRAGLGRRLLGAVGSAIQQAAESPERYPLATGVPVELGSDDCVSPASPTTSSTSSYRMSFGYGPWPTTAAAQRTGADAFPSRPSWPRNSSTN